MHVTVTAEAIPSVRSVIVRYVGSCHSVLKLPKPQSRTTSLVKSSTRQKPETSRATSAAT